MTTTIAPAAWEHAANIFNPHSTPNQWATPGALAQHLIPGTRSTQALQLIDDALTRLADTPDGRLIITMAPQEGKSSRAARDFPTWALTHNPRTRIAVASYAQGLANRNGRSIRNLIAAHPDLGIRIAPDHGAVSEWQIAGHQGGVLSVGRGAGITGRPVDLLIIDDPLKDRAEADSQVVRDACWDWWTDSLSTRLAPGAPVVLILTRWHEDDLAGRLLAAEDGHLWDVLAIPAQADHDPNKGETDPLGREVGEFMHSARGRTIDQWEAIKTRVGSRTWAALYQGRPNPAEGTVFHEDHWGTYTTPLWIDRPDGTRWVTGFDQILMSWDMAFKDTASSDYVCGQVWGRIDGNVYLLDQTHDRLDFPATLRAFKQLVARWPQATLKLVEDKANGSAVISTLTRSIPGIVPVNPEGGKVARANAITPFVEARNVLLPDPAIAPWVGDFLTEVTAFPSGKHDDQVDAMTQAIHRLLLEPLLDGSSLVTDADLYDELDNFEISPY